MQCINISLIGFQTLPLNKNFIIFEYIREM